MAGLLRGPKEGSEDLVSATLKVWASEPFDRLTANCGLSVLDYVEEALGLIGRAPEFLSEPRDLTGASLAGLWQHPTKFADYTTKLMARLDLPLTRSVLRGDVGLLEGMADMPTAGIYLGKDKWAVRGPRGVVITGARILRAWRLPCLKL